LNFVFLLRGIQAVDKRIFVRGIGAQTRTHVLLKCLRRFAIRMLEADDLFPSKRP
jgi:hypothetical protein